MVTPTTTRLRDSERALILGVLESVGWVIGGGRVPLRTRREAYYADPEDGEVGDLAASAPKQPKLSREHRRSGISSHDVTRSPP